MNRPQTEAEPGTACIVCARLVEWCAFCEGTECESCICYRCLIFELRQARPEPREYGG